jgi:GNAT superfamily N-acetyltransferase
MGISVGDAQLVSLHIEADDLSLVYPIDWVKVLEPQWNKLSNSASVFALFHAEELMCVGIVFTDELPELSELEEAVKEELNKLPYIGYLFTPEKYRRQGWARLWFQKLIAETGLSKLWLTIEEEHLYGFYQKLGFSSYRKDENEEVLLFEVKPLVAP